MPPHHHHRRGTPRRLIRKEPLARRKQSTPRTVVPFPLVPASPAQRAKVAALRCVVCDAAPVDPAHLVPQRLGGCAHADCVIPLCRTHHRLYDRGGLRLGLYLGDDWVAELRHALDHASGAALARALDGGGWAS